MASEYDVVVIGGGLGGYPAAIKLARRGYRVALVEERFLGGECTNYGCVPSKAVYRFAHALDSLKRILEEAPRISVSEMFKWVRSIVETTRDGIGYLLEKYGIPLYRAHAVLASEDGLVKLSTGESIRGRYIIVATGTDPRPLPNIGFDGKHVISNREFFEQQEIPQRILVVGGGVIGCELAYMLSSLGSEVHIVELLPRLLPGMDIDVARAIERFLRAKGVDIHKKTVVEAAEIKEDGTVEARLSDGSRITVDKMLVSIGRIPRSRDVGVENAGVKTDKKGFIVLEEGYRTSNPRVYAVGDVTGGPLLAHKALVESIRAAQSIHEGRPLERIDYHSIPTAVFTGLEIGSIGYTEDELREKGIGYKRIKLPLAFLSGVRIKEGEMGFIKILLSSSDNKPLGIHLVAPNAAEAIAEFIPLYLGKLSIREASEIPYPHLTISEAVRELAEYILQDPVHIFLRK